VCLKNPEEVVLLDKPVKAFRHLNLISHHSASATRAANRFSESSFPGDYASWEEAANALCARERTR
jgi:hypothetical protein